MALQARRLPVVLRPEGSRALLPRRVTTAAGPSSRDDASSGSAAATFSRRNWLEEDCGDVPKTPRPLDLDVSEMLRGGHALQYANASMLEAKLASAARGPATSYSEIHLSTLQELKAVEDRGIDRVEDAVAHSGYRFRPSAMMPFIHCNSVTLGTFLSVFGESVSISYLSGVKTAIADYYNDQIREIYANKPSETDLKELFKIARDEELEFVDAHTPDALDPAKEESDPVRKVAKASTKLLLQVSRVL